jgi:hypothetical protein
MRFASSASLRTAAPSLHPMRRVSQAGSIIRAAASTAGFFVVDGNGLHALSVDGKIGAAYSLAGWPLIHGLVGEGVGVRLLAQDATMSAADILHFDRRGAPVGKPVRVDLHGANWTSSPRGVVARGRETVIDGYLVVAEDGKSRSLFNFAYLPYSRFAGLVPLGDDVLLARIVDGALTLARVRVAPR